MHPSNVIQGLRPTRLSQEKELQERVVVVGEAAGGSISFLNKIKVMRMTLEGTTGLKGEEEEEKKKEDLAEEKAEEEQERESEEEEGAEENELEEEEDEVKTSSSSSVEDDLDFNSDASDVEEAKVSAPLTSAKDEKACAKKKMKKVRRPHLHT